MSSIRLSGLLLAFALLCGTALAAERSVQASPNPTNPAVSAAVNNHYAFELADRSQFSDNTWWIRPNVPQSSICYTMRTYLVSREERGSDSTRVTGMTTCLPSAKLRLRDVEPVSERRLK